MDKPKANGRERPKPLTLVYENPPPGYKSPGPKSSHPKPTGAPKTKRPKSNAARSRSTTPAPPPAPTSAAPSLFDFTYEEYKAANLNVSEQWELIGKIREEVPLTDRDEIDGLLLANMAKQLDECIFPTCKMMHVDPRAVKEMLMKAFDKAYPELKEREERERNEREEEAVARAVQEAKEAAAVTREAKIVAAPVTQAPAEMVAPTIQEPTEAEVTGINAILNDAKAAILGGGREEFKFKVEPSGDESSVVDTRSRRGTEATPPAESVHPLEPPKKKAKRQQLGAVQKEVNAYQAKRKRGRRKCHVLTLKSGAVAAKWEKLADGN